MGLIRTGLQAFIKGARYLCRLELKFHDSMHTAIDNTEGATADEKAAAKAAIEACVIACKKLDPFFKFFE